MNKKTVPSWLILSAIVAAVVVVLVVGNHAINPPLPKPTVVNMSRGYAPAPPPGYQGGFAKSQ